MQTLLLLDSEIYSSDRFTFLTRFTVALPAVNSLYRLHLNWNRDDISPFMCAGYKNFHLFHIAFRTFIFVSTAAAGLGFSLWPLSCWQLGLFPDFPSWQPVWTKLLRLALFCSSSIIYFLFFGLFISARLECVGVAAGDVGRIGFGFVLCANWKRWQYYQSFSVYTSVGLME